MFLWVADVDSNLYPAKFPFSSQTQLSRQNGLWFDDICSLLRQYDVFGDLATSCFICYSLRIYGYNKLQLELK